MSQLIQAGESNALLRRVRFHLVAANGITPVTGESGQPQISKDDDAFDDAGIGPLVEIGQGRYYAVLTSGSVAVAGTTILTRSKSANTAECPGDSVRIVGFNPQSLEADLKTINGNAEVVVAMFQSLLNRIEGTVDTSSGLVPAQHEFDVDGAFGSVPDGMLRGRGIEWTSGRNFGAMQRIKNYRKINSLWRFTIEPAIYAPASGDTFRII